MRSARSEFEVVDVDDITTRKKRILSEKLIVEDLNYMPQSKYKRGRLLHPREPAIPKRRKKEGS